MRITYHAMFGSAIGRTLVLVRLQPLAMEPLAAGDDAGKVGLRLHIRRSMQSFLRKYRKAR